MTFIPDFSFLSRSSPEERNVCCSSPQGQGRIPVFWLNCPLRSRTNYILECVSPPHFPVVETVSRDYSLVQYWMRTTFSISTEHPHSNPDSFGPFLSLKMFVMKKLGLHWSAGWGLVCLLFSGKASSRQAVSTVSQSSQSMKLEEKEGEGCVFREHESQCPFWLWTPPQLQGGFPNGGRTSLLL